MTDKFIVENQLDQIKHVSSSANEFWMGRELQIVLGYSEWRNFEGVILKERLACESIDINPEKHFGEANKKITGGKGAQLDRADWYLSRHGCYLVAMNGDPAKPEIAIAQTYFASQTRKQEEFEKLVRDQKRIELRLRVKNANRNLSSVASQVGVSKFGVFHDSGYRGLYGELGLADIKTKKGIPPTEDLLDRAGRAELAANEFRITQTEEKLARVGTIGEAAACNTHHAVGREVRETIRKLQGTMPENLKPEPSIKKYLTKKKAKEITSGEKPKLA